MPPAPALLPLAQWPIDVRRRLIGVFTDIDDTLTTDGAITPDALAALHDLRRAGLAVIAITGRSVGWSEAVTRGWPVNAVVAENGAVALRFSRGNAPEPNTDADSLLSKIYQQDAPTRAANFARMQQVARRVLREVPLAQLARDSDGRETDIAIDHGEFARLEPARIAQVVRIMQAEGMMATVSSIHVNGWYGAHDKLAGARWIARELLHRELDAEIERWAYVGDSTNDQVMFEHFANSIAVANIARFLPGITHPPRYLTQAERGAGFAEVAAAILAVRRPV
ncbi:MAG: Haloacid dehalogenase-like hydrolase [Burkholderiaceae bacterium]|nr:MAG: Haloacid dehalogenase-like hydrolase [Burkholderiaceae bacterium]